MSLLALALAATAAQAQPAGPVFSVRNATKAPIRCFLMEGGPITQLVTFHPGRERAERVVPGQKVSLSCPKVRDTVFGPLPPGRYAFVTVKGRVDLKPAP